MTCYKDEIFGPVLDVMYADTLDDALKIINRYFIFLKKHYLAIPMVMVVLYLHKVVHVLVNSNMKLKLVK